MGGFGVEDGVIEGVEGVVFYPDIAVEGFFAIEFGDLGVDADDGFAELIDGGETGIVEGIVADRDVFYCARFEPAVGVAGDEDGGAAGFEGVFFYEDFAGCGEEDAAGAVAAEEAVVDPYIGRPGEVFEGIAGFEGDGEGIGEGEFEVFRIDGFEGFNDGCADGVHAFVLDQADRIAGLGPGEADALVVHEFAQ